MPDPHTAPDHRPGGELEPFAARPYALTSGRTRPSAPLDLASMVRATGRGQVPPGNLGLVHNEALQLCHAPVSVTEVAGRLNRSITVTKILLSDLIELGMVIARFPPPTAEFTNDPTTLRAVIDGLRAL